eukprot:scaffold13974_cov36-Cyclotella_meneghiniana.AAC.3
MAQFGSKKDGRTSEAAEVANESFGLPSISPHASQNPVKDSPEMMKLLNEIDAVIDKNDVGGSTENTPRTADDTLTTASYASDSSEPPLAYKNVQEYFALHGIGLGRMSKGVDKIGENADGNGKNVKELKKESANEHAQDVKRQIEENNRLLLAKLEQSLNLNHEMNKRLVQLSDHVMEIKQSNKAIEDAANAKAMKKLQKQFEEEKEKLLKDNLDLIDRNRALKREKALYVQQYINIEKANIAMQKEFDKKWHAFRTKCTCAFSE